LDAVEGPGGGKVGRNCIFQRVALNRLARLDSLIVLTFADRPACFKEPAMERRRSQPTLMDAYVSQLGDPTMREKLARLNQAIDWERLAGPIRSTYRNDTAAGGRPNVPVVMMLKVVMLQKWFNLSDPAMEGMLLDRISFREFVGLNMVDDAIDETTIVKFRRRLREHGLTGMLFDDVVAQLREQELVVEEGTLMDATIIQAPRGKTTDDGLGHTRQKSATFTKKHGRTYHGYKAHVATDAQGLIVDYVYDTASVHDARHADQLIDGEAGRSVRGADAQGVADGASADEAEDVSGGAAGTTFGATSGATSGGAVFADSAYMDKKRKQRLEEQGVFCGIIERRVRGQAELTAEQKAHNRFCASFRAFVEHPFAWLKRFGGFLRTRYRGLRRNAEDFALGAIAYNIERSLSLRS